MASVELLNVGWLTAPAWVIRRDEPQGTDIRFPVPAYLIETGGERILVDTGLNPEAIADPPGFYGGADGLSIFAFEQEAGIADQVDLDTLTMVVLTHLHWDHVGGLPQVPADVPVVIQESEWAAGHDPGAMERNFFFPRDYDEVERPLRLIDGDHDLLGDGSVELLFTPGHTPGHQSVRVDELVIGGDVAHFAEGLDDHRFPIFGADHEAQGRSAERLRELRDAGLTVMPGHDPEILTPRSLDSGQPGPA